MRVNYEQFRGAERTTLRIRCRHRQGNRRGVESSPCVVLEVRRLSCDNNGSINRQTEGCACCLVT
jgi:hypothetical protein